MEPISNLDLWQMVATSTHALGRDTCALLVALQCVSHSDVDLADALSSCATQLSGLMSEVLKSVVNSKLPAPLLLLFAYNPSVCLLRGLLERLKWNRVLSLVCF